MSYLHGKRSGEFEQRGFFDGGRHVQIALAIWRSMIEYSTLRLISMYCYILLYVALYIYCYILTRGIKYEE